MDRLPVNPSWRNLAGIFLILLLISGIITLTAGSALAPFIYSLF